MKKRIIIIIGVITALLVILGIVIYKVKTATEANSIAIIGGADGPAAVFLIHENIMIPLIILAMIVIGCIVYFIKRKKTNSKNKNYFNSK